MSRSTHIIIASLGRVLIVLFCVALVAACSDPEPCTLGLMRLPHGECPTRCDWDPRRSCYPDGAAIPDAPLLDAAGFDVPSFDSPSIDEPMVDVVDAPSEDVKAIDAPTADLPVADSPASDVPDAEAGPACDGGMTPCGASCVSTMSDPSNCGACGHACALVANSTPTCSGGTCGFTCAAGYELAGGGCDVALPRAISPISGARVSARTPRFRWQRPAGVDMVVLEICSDPACAVVTASVMSADDNALAPRALGPGVWFWRLRGRVGTASSSRTSPIWEIETTLATADTQAVIGFVTDFNRDGLADVAVGASGQTVAGAVGIVYGDRGFTTRSVTLVHSPSAGHGDFGGVVSAGDINGDGFCDLIVARASESDLSRRVAIYLGASAGITDSADLYLSPPSDAQPYFGYDAVVVGDVNGDGYGDILVSETTPVGPAGTRVRSYLGGATGAPVFASTFPTASSDLVGHAIAGIGDVDADGFCDVAVARSGSATDSSVLVFRGGATGLETVPTSQFTDTSGGGASIGYLLSCGGDFDGDGRADILASRAAQSGGSDWAAVLFYGDSANAQTPFPVPSGVTFTGAAPAAAVGDLDGDGRSEIAVSWSGSDQGSMSVFAGRGRGVAPVRTTFTTLASTYCGGLLSRSIGTPGDVDGDRADDLFVGCVPFTSGPSTVLYFHTRAGTYDPPVRIDSPLPATNSWGIAVGVD